MIYYDDSVIGIYFGNRQNSIEPRLFLNNEKSKTLDYYERCLNLNKIVFLEQIHSASGILVSADTVGALVKKQDTGDYLITNEPNIGIAVYTADCLPLVLYDCENKAIGICHAGRAGTIKGVTPKAIEAMSNAFGTKLKSLKIFFGPSAKVCCYEVGKDIVQSLEKDLNNFCSEKNTQVILQKKDRIFFNITEYNKLQLEDFGVASGAFIEDFNKCTICDLSFCSYRREGKYSLRQISIVYLKP